MRTFFFLFVLQSFAPIIGAQNGISTAFAKSYAAEGGKNYAEAIAALKGVYDPASYPMNLRLGWLYYLNADHVQSQVFYQKAIELQPQSVEPRMGYVLPLAAIGKWQTVAKTYREVLELDPNNTVAHYRLASIHYYNKDFETALVHAKRVVLLYPFDYDGQLILAKTEISRGNIVEAKAALAVCLQHSPGAKEPQELWERVK